MSLVAGTERVKHGVRKTQSSTGRYDCGREKAGVGRSGWSERKGEVTADCEERKEMGERHLQGTEKRNNRQ